MDNTNLDVVLAVGGIAVFVVLVVVIVLSNALSKGRKETRQKLERFKARFEAKSSLKGEGARSIRVNQQQSGLVASLSELLPRRDQIKRRLSQAGLGTDLSRYTVISLGLAVFALIGLLAMGAGLVLALFMAIIAGVGLPHMWVSNRITARTTKFTKQFPEAMDLMVRGLKSGLPVNECIMNVAKELPAPTGVEFQRISDAMRLGKQLEEALWETADRLNTPDFKFFVISLVVQRETGGNLGETLGNLATILRQRQAMKLKVKALSSEAKASAWIVGSLPFIMLGVIMMMNYDYGIILFTEPKAMMAGIGALVWMSIGVFIMSRMTKFEV
ncbi:type II secretion system F family protein [Kordiimonas gwangyangensis]|uniref:type II secretion system F family protein n=1 Tax=Kordiimonas gwangyangensis TaxID=288022 RepID=UPI00036D1FFD|nr:type II secretion system F family protein [Kordiimonas gwangyangensis]